MEQDPEPSLVGTNMVAGPCVSEAAVAAVHLGTVVRTLARQARYDHQTHQTGTPTRHHRPVRTVLAVPPFKTSVPSLVRD